MESKVGREDRVARKQDEKQSNLSLECIKYIMLGKWDGVNVKRKTEVNITNLNCISLLAA